MNYSIEKESGTPAYLQLYNLLKADIVKGVYRYEDKLPSKRLIAEETSLSVITVEHSMQILAEEGYIESRERSGYFVIFKEKDFQGIALPAGPVPAKTLEPKASNDFPFSTLAKSMRRVLQVYGSAILDRSPGTGCDELKQAICAYLARSRSMSAQPEQIVIGAGAEYLYGLIAQLFKDESPFALENPSYDKIRAVYEAFGISCDMLSLRKDGIDSYELKNTKARILHTTPFNSFPSGVTVGVSKKHEYLNWAEDRRGIIIEDNYDSELTVSHKAEESLYAMAGGKNVIYINTFSQTISPSVRIGYMLLPKSMVSLFNKRLGFYSCPVPVFEQYVLCDLIDSGDFERHINRVRRQKRKNINIHY